MSSGCFCEAESKGKLRPREMFLLLSPCIMTKGKLRAETKQKLRASKKLSAAPSSSSSVSLSSPPPSVESQRVVLATSYSRIRSAIQAYRHDRKEGLPRKDALYKLTQQLSRPTCADALVLARIVVLRQRHPEKKWCNLRKSADVLGRCLPAVHISSAGGSNWRRLSADSVGEYVKASFKARAICLTSERFDLELPRNFIPGPDQRYATYGHSHRSVLSAGTKSPFYAQYETSAQTEHERRLAIYEAWDTSPATQSLRPSKEKRLDVETIQRATGIGWFTALQILTDVAALSKTLISTPSKLGSGVKLDKDFTIGDMRRFVFHANSKRAFVRAFGCKLNLWTGGHLVCEIRQWVTQGMKENVVLEFLMSLNSLPATREQKDEFFANLATLEALSWID